MIDIYSIFTPFIYLFHLYAVFVFCFLFFVRVDERISIDVALSVLPKLFTQDNESYIEEHGKTMKHACKSFEFCVIYMLILPLQKKRT